MSALCASRPFLLAMVAIGALLALPDAARADQSEIVTVPIDVVFIDEGASADCGFLVEVHVTGTLRQRITSSGFVNTFTHNWTQVYTNLDSGTSLATQSPSVVRVEFNADGSVVMTITGLSLGFQVPGQGAVFMDVGRVVLFFESFDDPEPDVVALAGRHDPVAAACAALA